MTGNVFHIWYNDYSNLHPNLCSLWLGRHDDVVKWKHFLCYWPFVRGIHRGHKGQWRGALMFSLICTWINGWVNNGEAGDLRRHRGHHDVNVMGTISSYNPKIRRSVAAYVAAQRDLTRCWHCHKSLKKATLSARVKLWNLQCRTHSISITCCSKSVHPVYIKFSNHQNKYAIYALAKYYRNRANVIYLFLCLRKTAVTFDRECFSYLVQWLFQPSS